MNDSDEDDLDLFADHDEVDNSSSPLCLPPIPPIPPRPVLLRFHGLPHADGYIYVHDALNEIGKKRFPETWGHGLGNPYCLGLPFKRKSLTDENRRARGEFIKSVSELILALKAGKIRTYFITDSDAPTAIPAKSMRWIKYGQSICRTGYFTVDKEKRPVILKEEDFHNWLNPEAAIVAGPKINTKKIVKATSNELARLSLENGNLRFNRAWILGVIQEAFVGLDTRLSVTKAVSEVCKAEPSFCRKVGAPTSAESQLLADLKTRASENLKKILANLAAGGASQTINH